MPQTRGVSLSLASVLCLFGLVLPAPALPQDGGAVEKLPPGKNILWQDPGDVAARDLVEGVGGRDGEPKPPFTFVKEDTSGTTPKIFVTDAKGRSWNVKWGPEAKAEIVSNRLAWACGYIVETEYLVTRGQIAGVQRLTRAKPFVQDGYFADGRFQLRDDGPKFLKRANWSWINNPFLGAPQLNGLKILVMLLSDWDTKDARDKIPEGPSTADSNLAVFQQDDPDDGPHYLFAVVDWGASLGRWGGATVRSKWDCPGYAAQTQDLVQGVHGNLVEWGYSGKHTPDIVKGIHVDDVRWLLGYLGGISDEQIRQALAAAGATPGEMECYSGAIRARINQLKRAAEGR